MVRAVQRRDLLIAAWLVAWLAPACSRGGSANPTEGLRPAAASAAPITTPEELTAPEGHLTLADVTLARDGKPAVSLSRDGSVMDLAKKQELGKLHRDGRFVDSRGQLVAQLTQEGEVTLPNGDFLPVTIAADGAVKLLKEGRELTIDGDGGVAGANPSGPAVSFSKLDAPARRAAMFLLVLVAFPTRPVP